MDPNEKLASSKKRGIDWSTLIRKEDWLVVWIGFSILLIVTLGLVTEVPKIGTWSTSITESFEIMDLPKFGLLGVLLLLLTSIAVKLMGDKLVEKYTE